MSHYITVPVNENGIVFDADMDAVVSEAMAVSPFGFQDVYIYSHGWSVNAVSALDTYNRFTVDMARLVLITTMHNPHGLAKPPKETLGVGIHWPSEITEDQNPLLNAAQLFTFYTMEHRADAVGRNAVYAMLRLILAERAGVALPLRIFMVGHSFGCKVVLAALQEVQADVFDATRNPGGPIVVPPGTAFRIALLQAATDDDNLVAGDIYGKVSALPNLRLLTTTSSLDRALGQWYPDAGKLANLFHRPPSALGSVGPDPATFASPNGFGPATALSIGTGFTAAAMPSVANRLVVADLSPVHADRVAAKLYPTGFAGSHGDIAFAEVYEMLCGFFYS